jgi:uncharacterized membrane protein
MKKQFKYPFIGMGFLFLAWTLESLNFYMSISAALVGAVFAHKGWMAFLYDKDKTR